jgi:hypothetical protein
MPSFSFTTGELHLPHTRLPVKDIRLDVVVGSDPKEAAPAVVSEFLNGSLRVTGELALDCAPGGCKLRPGLQALLTLPAPDGRATRLSALLIETVAITAPAPGLRTYRWAFLVTARPAADPLRLFPGPEAEVSLEELLQQLGVDRSAVTSSAVRFTSEGGFQQ